MPMSSKFLMEFTGEKIVKIGQYLAKMWTKYDSLLFFGPPCRPTYSSDVPAVHACISVYTYIGCGRAVRLVGQYASRPSLRTVPTSRLRHAYNIPHDPRGIVWFSTLCYLRFPLLASA